MMPYLSFYKMSYADFCHNRDGDGIDDLFDHSRVALMKKKKKKRCLNHFPITRICESIPCELHLLVLGYQLGHVPMP